MPDDGDAPASTVYDELVRNAHTLAERADLAPGDVRPATDVLLGIIRHGPVLTALYATPLDRRGIEDRLDVSRATSHRLTRWLDEHGLAAKADGAYHLTGTGIAFAEAVLRFERTVETADRLSPLLDLICEDHMELVVEPLADATLTAAKPGDPYAPVRRFRELLGASEQVRGFNTTPMLPLDDGWTSTEFAASDAELIYLPEAAEAFLENHPERARAAVDAGHLRLRTRDALPYGLAILDDRVAIGGYDETTGALRVLVDTDAAYAREWAERTYAAFRRDSTPLRVPSA